MNATHARQAACKKRCTTALAAHAAVHRRSVKRIVNHGGGASELAAVDACNGDGVCFQARALACILTLHASSSGPPPLLCAPSPDACNGDGMCLQAHVLACILTWASPSLCSPSPSKAAHVPALGHELHASKLVCNAHHACHAITRSYNACS